MGYPKGILIDSSKELLQKTIFQEIHYSFKIRLLPATQNQLMTLQVLSLPQDGLQQTY